MNPVFLVAVNLLLTVLIEGVLMLAFAANKKAVYHSVLVNMLTNPLVNLFLLLWAFFVTVPEVPYYYIATAFLEAAAFFTEGILYCKMGDFGLKKSFFVSFCLNAASYSTGLLLQ